jgi:hypothetical protein
MTYVPRVTIVRHKNGRVTVFLPDGQKACTKCRRRPRAPGQRWCQICRTEYNWQRRENMIEVLLTPDEWAAVKEVREMLAKGR